MMKKIESFGPLAYIVGLAIAIVAGIVTLSANLVVLVSLLLGLIGIFVGLMNIKDREVLLFLVAAIAFMISASSLASVFTTLGAQLGVNFLGQAVTQILTNIIVLTAPAAAVVAIKALYDLSKG
jgi:ATP synthase protein I